MYKQFLLLALILLSGTTLYPARGQKKSINLTFTAVSHSAYVRLDSIRVMNRTQGGGTTVHWPDTTITIDVNYDDKILMAGYATGYPVGIEESPLSESSFLLLQNHPNPVGDKSAVTLCIPSDGEVNLTITDLSGHVRTSLRVTLEKGSHEFCLATGGGGLFLLTAMWKAEIRSIKLIGTYQGQSSQPMLEYAGNSGAVPTLKNGTKGYDLGMVESGILDNPFTDQTYTFEFATNIPCPGVPTVTYEGKTYNTIQVRSQCWMKENLNVGNRINGTQEMDDNSVIEKYCYDDLEANCTAFGALYQWNEMMQYSLIEGSRGICPSGWHIPTDEEWKVLEGAADSQYGIGDPKWDGYILRGDDAGYNLKSATGWSGSGNGTDLFGFKGLPAGYRVNLYGEFRQNGNYQYWWSSSFPANSVCRSLSYLVDMIYRNFEAEGNGFSVRCLKDQ